MFARQQRIRKGDEIIYTLRQGKRRSTPALTCYFVAKPATLGRVTVIVDTKVSKKAVERNQVKRRVRAILRELGLPAGDLIIRAQKGILALSYEELRSQLNQCLGGL